MAGTISLSMTQQMDRYGNLLAGGQLYFMQAGTVATPQNAFQDSGLLIPWPNPITLDAAGRIPAFYLADGQIKIRLQDKNGVVQLAADNVLVVGPSSGGGGGGGGVDPTTVMQTGDVKIRYDNAIISGFVRLNGKTIGSSSSGATELADPSAQALFLFLWGADTTLVLTPGGRGSTAAADWAANKQMALPDGRSRILAMLGDMGGVDAGFWTGVTFTKGNSTTLGALGGRAATINCNVALGVANLPALTPHGSNAAVNVTVTATINNIATTGGANPGFTGSASLGMTQAQPSSTGTVPAQTFTGTAMGGTATAFNTCPPILLVTGYIKL